MFSLTTMKDIALEAGVSVMTVSNVINNKTDTVSQKTIDAVNSIIKKLDYTPNMLARSLVLNSSRVVAYINTIGFGLGDPFNAAFIDSLERSLSKKGYYLMIKTINHPNDLKNFLKNRNVDGMVFMGIFDREMVKIVSESNIPTVLIDSYFKCRNTVNIGLDDERSAFNACEYLIKRGHRKIAVTTQSSFKIGVNKARLAGFKKAMNKHNIPIRREFLFDTCNTSEKTISIDEHLAKSDITAVLSFSDVTAIEIMRGITKSRKQIPEDISVLGFDDIDLYLLTTPQLSTIHQDTYNKGQIAVEQLIRLLSGQKCTGTIILPTHIIERESVKSLALNVIFFCA